VAGKGGQQEDQEGYGFSRGVVKGCTTNFPSNNKKKYASFFRRLAEEMPVLSGF
jgi:hypothetical protein